MINAEQKANEWIVGKNEQMNNQARALGKLVMESSGDEHGTWNAARRIAKDWLGLKPLLGIKKTSQSEHEAAFMAQLTLEGEKVGVDIQAEHDQWRAAALGTGPEVSFFGATNPATNKPWTPDEKAANMSGQFDAANGAFVRKMLERVVKAGGNPMAGASKHTRQLLQQDIAAGKNESIDDVVGTIANQGTKVGINVAQNYKDKINRNGQDDANYNPTTTELIKSPKGVEVLQKAIEDIRAKGTDPFRGSRLLEQKFDKLIEETKRTNDILQKRNAVPPPQGGGGVMPGRK